MIRFYKKIKKIGCAMKKQLFLLCAAISFVFTCATFTSVLGMNEKIEEKKIEVENSSCEYYEYDGDLVDKGGYDNEENPISKGPFYTKLSKSLFIMGSMEENDKVEVYIKGQSERHNWLPMSLKTIKEKYKFKKSDRPVVCWKPSDHTIFYFEEKNPTDPSKPTEMRIDLKDVIKISKQNVNNINFLLSPPKEPLPVGVVVDNFKNLGIEIPSNYKKEEKEKKEKEEPITKQEENFNKFVEEKQEDPLNEEEESFKKQEEEKKVQVQKQIKKLKIQSGVFGIFGLGTGVTSATLFVASLLILSHIIVQIIVATHTLEAITKNALLMKILNKLGIDASKAAAFVTKIETKMRENKWTNWLQKGNKTLLTLFVFELLGCAGCSLLAILNLLATGTFAGIAISSGVKAKKMIKI